jgi:guanine nucleotide-binding protein subunit alpha
MELHVGGGFACGEVDTFPEIIWSNIVQNIRAILEAMEDLKIPLEDQMRLDHAQTIFLQPDQIQNGFPQEVGIAVTGLWADAGLQKAFERRCKYQLDESVPYFASNIERLAAPEYIPSQEDVLRTRVMTTGITQTTFEYSVSNMFRIFDVGGMRIERKKWFRAFEGVDSIVFTVDTSAYCRVLSEDPETNRMTEQMVIWDSICNNRWFVDTSFILVFTKIDCLPDVFKLCPVINYFSDYNVPAFLDMAILVQTYLSYIKNRFMSLMQSESARQRTTVMYVDLVHTEDYNPAGAVFEEVIKQRRRFA